LLFLHPLYRDRFAKEIVLNILFSTLHHAGQGTIFGCFQRWFSHFYIVFFVSIHFYAEEKRKFYSLTALIFASLSALILVTDYFIQVSVIQPSLINGESDGISILTQYNPHGLFIALEELGYIFMSISFLFIAFAFAKTSKSEKAVRWVFITGFVLTIISLILVSIVHRIEREYRFEVIVITINWFVLIISGLLTAKVFKRNLKR